MTDTTGTTNWTADTTGEVPPVEFGQMYQVGELPLSPDWFTEHGVPMREGEIEPGWPVLFGTVRTDSGPFTVMGESGNNRGVALYAMSGMKPNEAVSTFARVMGHGAEPLHVFPAEDDFL